MRILLIWPREKKETSSIISALQKDNHEIVYCVANEVDSKDFSEIIFHDYDKAYAGESADNIDASVFQPCIEMIEKMHKFEAIALTMMNKRYDAMGTDERRHLFYSNIQYWYGVLKKYKPEIVIFPTVPHAIFNFVIFELARILNIKTFMFEDAAITDRLLYYSNFWDNSNLIKERINNNQGKNFSIDDLSKDIAKYYQNQIDALKDSTPSEIHRQKKTFSKGKQALGKIKIAIQSIKDLSVFEKFINYFFRLFKENLKKEYTKVQTQPDLNKKFVYFPLHYQPERTSCPQGDIFVDQVLATELLSSALPKDWTIYVKEHPIQWLTRGLKFNNARYQGYYKKLASLKNVQVIPIETDTYELLNKSQVIVTITGTVGREAIMRLKPVMVFGYAWYKECPGVYKVDDFKSCQKALKGIKSGVKIEAQDVINYLKSFDEATIHGYLEDYGQNISVTKQENTDNLIKIIINELNKINN